MTVAEVIAMLNCVENKERMVIFMGHSHFDEVKYGIEATVGGIGKKYSFELTNVLLLKARCPMNDNWMAENNGRLVSLEKYKGGAM